mmetsp:Transcript_79814/g.151594  ORF Transcript_79814/g.151594 Transcript_79814/m.151594 type:complete len:127 (+) Transcript_79814:64-444(+)
MASSRGFLQELLNSVATTTSALKQQEASCNCCVDCKMLTVVKSQAKLPYPPKLPTRNCLEQKGCSKQTRCAPGLPANHQRDGKCKFNYLGPDNIMAIIRINVNIFIREVESAKFIDCALEEKSCHQ